MLRSIGASLMMQARSMNPSPLGSVKTTNLATGCGTQGTTSSQFWTRLMYQEPPGVSRICRSGGWKADHATDAARQSTGVLPDALTSSPTKRTTVSCTSLHSTLLIPSRQPSTQPSPRPTGILRSLSVMDGSQLMGRVERSAIVRGASGRFASCTRRMLESVPQATRR